MAPNIPSAKITLSCPLFAADFDPRDDSLLLVGGGGGEGRSGVGNKIVRNFTLLLLIPSLLLPKDPTSVPCKNAMRLM